MGAVAAVVAVVVALTVEGCGSGGTNDDRAGPGTVPTATSSNSASATPSESRDKKATERAEVEAAVRAYYDAMDIAIRTGDTGPYEAITLPECECRSFSRAVEALFETGSTRNAGVRVVRVEPPIRTGDLLSVEVVVANAAYQEVDEGGRTTSESDAYKANWLLGMTRQSGSLLVDSALFQGRAK